MKILIVIVTLLVVPVSVNAFSVSCDYSTGKQICNGQKIKDTKECKDKNIDLSSVLTIGMIGRGANDIARKEYNDAISCIEFAGKKKKKLKKISTGTITTQDKGVITNKIYGTYPAEVPFYQGMSLMPGQSTSTEAVFNIGYEQTD